MYFADLPSFDVMAVVGQYFSQLPHHLQCASSLIRAVRSGFLWRKVCRKRVCVSIGLSAHHTIPASGGELHFFIDMIKIR
jgi:hypothetical protein